MYVFHDISMSILVLYTKQLIFSQRTVSFTGSISKESPPSNRVHVQVLAVCFFRGYSMANLSHPSCLILYVLDPNAVGFFLFKLHWYQTKLNIEHTVLQHFAHQNHVALNFTITIYYIVVLHICLHCTNEKHPEISRKSSQIWHHTRPVKRACLSGSCGAGSRPMAACVSAMRAMPVVGKTCSHRTTGIRNINSK